jgi:hypothetical protein
VLELLLLAGEALVDQRGQVDVLALRLEAAPDDPRDLEELADQLAEPLRQPLGGFELDPGAASAARSGCAGGAR